MSLWLKLENHLGSDIESISRELVETQRRLGIQVRTKFNDKMLCAGPQTTAQELIDEYWQTKKSGKGNPSESPNS